MKNFLLTLFLANSIFVNAQETLVKELNQLIESKTEGIAPGIAVGIVKEGDIVFEKYIGYANLDHQVKINQYSRFNIASAAKQYTALCVLKLVSEGKLNLDDDFRKYLPGYYPEIKEPIKISHLITHSSGIRDYSDLLSVQGKPWWKRVGYDNEDALELLAAQTDLNFKPGTDYLYSNSGYTMLTALIEKISGMDFITYSTTVFKDLGLNNTKFSSNHMSVIPNKTEPYNNWGDGKWSKYPMVVNLYGDGFLFTTLKDQLTWEKILQNKSTSLQWILESQKPIAKSEIKNYGFGIEIDNYKGFDVLKHEGATGSYGAQFLRFPKEKLSIFVMTNNGNVWTTGLANEIADLLLDIDVSETKPTTSIKKNIESRPLNNDIVGSYELEGGTIIKIVNRENKLYREIYNRDPVQLIHEEGNYYYYETFKDLKIAFTQNKKGTYNFTLYQPGFENRLAFSIKDEKWSLDDYKTLDGDYYSEELKLTITVFHNDGDDYKITRNGKSGDAKLILKDHLLFSDYKMKAARDIFGRVTALLLDYNRNKNIRFERVNKSEFKKSQNTLDGGQIITGTTSASIGNGSGDILLSKSNALGNEEWFSTFGGKGYDKASNILITNDGGYVIVGSTSSFGKGNYDVYVIKTDVNGKEEWSKTYGDFYNDYGYTIEQNEKGYTIKGTKQACTSNTDVFNRECEDYIWIINVDDSGKELSNETLEKIIKP